MISMKLLRAAPGLLTASALLLLATGARADIVVDWSTAGPPIQNNVLANPGFESGDPSGWFGGGINAVGAPAEGALSGTYAAQLKGGGPNGGVAVALQIFDAEPGDEVQLSAEMLTETALPAGTRTFAGAKIIFRDAAGNDLVPESVSRGFLNTTNPGINAAPNLNITVADTWAPTVAQGVAPEGTAQVLFLLLNADLSGADNPGDDNPIWYDDIQASFVKDNVDGRTFFFDDIDTFFFNDFPEFDLAPYTLPNPVPPERPFSYILPTTDLSLPGIGGVGLIHQNADTALTVNGGSVLQSGSGLYTDNRGGSFSGKSNIFVDGPGSRIEIAGVGQTGSIELRGLGDFDITNGGVVSWASPNNCAGGFGSCDILIGADSVSNTGIVISGAGSLLDASAANGAVFVGWRPSLVEGDSEDFLVAVDGGEIRSAGAAVALGLEEDRPWEASDGYVQGSVLVSNGSWIMREPSPEAVDLEVGVGDGSSSNVGIIDGGLIDIAGEPGQEAAFFVGQTLDGRPTINGSNMFVVDGGGSLLNVDNNLGSLSGSRIANGFVTVRNQGTIQIDESLFLVTGKTAETLSEFNTRVATNIGLSDLSDLDLDVNTGGSILITDNTGVGINALILGQTPDDGVGIPVDVAVRGAGSNITVMNNASSKIALGATAFGLPTVSNIGTGTLTISDTASVTIENGDFVIAARTDDDADVFMTDSTLSADRVVVGWSDFEGGSVAEGDSSGLLSLNNGVINGDVIVDDNGILIGVGIINGALIAEGGFIDPGFSPGTITVESFVLGAGSELIMELALNADGSVNTAASDLIVATTGTIDLTAGSVTFDLSSADPSTSVEEIVGGGQVLSVADVFESTEEVAIAAFVLTDSSGSISEEELEQQVAIVSFEKKDCKKGGWRSLSRPDGTGFKNQGRCIKFVKTGK